MNVVYSVYTKDLKNSTTIEFASVLFVCLNGLGISIEFNVEVGTFHKDIKRK